MALSITTTYNDDYGRVQISFTGANADADYAKVEFSLDQINWATIRGGDTVPISGGAGHIDHYDGYKFGVVNYYRVSAYDSALIGSVNDGAMATANNASVVPALPAGLVAGNMMVLFATHRNTAATVSTPAGWTAVTGGASNFKVFSRAYQAGDTAPTVAFTGGSAGDSCSAFIRGFSNAQAPVQAAYLDNVSAQDVLYPGGSQPTIANPVWLMHIWKQSTTTGAGTPTGFTGQWGAANTAGANAESDLAWRTLASSDIRTVTAGVSLFTGGSAAISRARLLYMAPRSFLDQGTQSLTPVLPNKYVKPYWLMNPQRPGQNVRVEITGFDEVSYGTRTGIYEVLGRSFPVTVTDIMGSGSFTLGIDAANKTEAKDIAGRIALGDPMYLLSSDPNSDVDTLYFTALGLKRGPDTLTGSWTVTVECREVGQPAPSVYGSTYTWQNASTDYASWAALVADPQNTTWQNLTDRISNSVIVVP